jgi:glucokinase
MEKSAVLGVDIGGSHITAALVDLENGKVIEESLKRVAIDSKGSAVEIFKVWTQVITDVASYAADGELRIGIAMPGPFDYENGISLIIDQDKFKSLYQVNVKDELAKCLELPSSNIRFINDAAGFLQGEIFCGAGKGYKNVLGLTLGTGLGAAVAINGVAKDAALWNSSFLSGIAEDYFSTRWFVNKYESLTGDTFAGVKELAGIAEKDPFARQIFNEFGRGLGHFLADVIKENNSEIVILGGNIAQAYSLFAPHLIGNLEAYHLTTPVKVAELSEHAALIGAASQWNEKQR